MIDNSSIAWFCTSPPTTNQSFVLHISHDTSRVRSEISLLERTFYIHKKVSGARTSVRVLRLVISVSIHVQK